MSPTPIERELFALLVVFGLMLLIPDGPVWGLILVLVVLSVTPYFLEGAKGSP